MFGKRTYNSPEQILSRKQSRDRKLLVGRCDGCANLGELGEIRYCEKDKDFFKNRFKMNRPKCKDFIWA